MATEIELICCAGGNPRLAEIAIKAGFRYGSQLPETVYFQDEEAAEDESYRLHFADQDWENPRREAYMELLDKYRPHLATVLDLEWWEQLDEVLGWAEEIANYVQVVIIIPKVKSIITELPRTIGETEVRLGYSVKTGYGGTSVPPSEFLDWPVHLLGGSPHEQLAMAGRSLKTRGIMPLDFTADVPRLDVRSVDGNMHHKMATRHCKFWVPGTARYANNYYWPALAEFHGEKWGDGSDKADAPYEAFRRSCINIMEAWRCSM